MINDGKIHISIYICFLNFSTYTLLMTLFNVVGAIACIDLANVNVLFGVCDRLAKYNWYLKNKRLWHSKQCCH